MFPSGVTNDVITQVVPWLLKGYDRGNHRPIFGLQVLAHLQSERALSLGFSFVDNDFRLVIGFTGFCLCFGGKVERGSFQVERQCIVRQVSNHWAWSHGVGLLVHFLGHKRNKEQGSCIRKQHSS